MILVDFGGRFFVDAFIAFKTIEKANLVAGNNISVKIIFECPFFNRFIVKSHLATDLPTHYWEVFFT